MWPWRSLESLAANSPFREFPWSPASPVKRSAASWTREQGDKASSDKYNRLSRVIAGWRRDPDFRDKRGGAASLDIKGDGLAFSELVRRYSGDMTPRAMLDELLRVDAVKLLRVGRVKLLVRSYLPGSGDEVKIQILGTDVGHLISTIDHNLQIEPESTVCLISSARCSTTTSRRKCWRSFVLCLLNPPRNSWKSWIHGWRRGTAITTRR